MEKSCPGKWAYNWGMKTCPKCHSTTRQYKAGLTKAGSQRYRCMLCGKKYTPVVKRHGYDEPIHTVALELLRQGENLRETAGHLGIHRHTVAAWVKQQAEKPKPEDKEAKSG